MAAPKPAPVAEAAPVAELAPAATAAPAPAAAPPPGTNGGRPAPRVVSETAKRHGAEVLRRAAVNPYAAVHASRETPIEVLHDAIVFNTEEQLRKYLEPVIRKLGHADAALVLGAFATSFHAGYSMGQQDAHQGADWHEELRQAAMQGAPIPPR